MQIKFSLDLTVLKSSVSHFLSNCPYKHFLPFTESDFATITFKITPVQTSP